MIFRFQFFVLLGLGILFSLKGYAFTYYRPAPSSPVLEKSINEISDSVTYSLIMQVHRGLFKFDGNSQPIPDLVEDFEVENKGRKYIFNLKGKLRFHSGKELTTPIILSSLRRSLTSNNSHLANKFGFGKILTSKNKKDRLKKWMRLSESNGSLIVELSQPVPKLIHFLADPRMSITINGLTTNGLGAFKVDEVKKDQIILSKVKHKGNEVSKLIYLMRSKDEAIGLMKKRQVHDLSLYDLSAKDIKSISSQSYVVKTLFPRTYSFFLNADKMNIEARKSVTKLILDLNLTDSCKLSGKRNEALVPRGFAGHSKITSPSKVTVKKKTVLSVYIPKEVGNEECIRDALSKIENKYLKLQVTIQPFPEVAAKWIKREIDIYYGYIEGESDFSFFEHFLPSSTFPLGSKKDLKTEMIHRQLTEATSLKQRHSISAELSRHLNNQYYFVPIYSPVGRLLFKKGVQINKNVMQAAYQIDFSKVTEDK